MAFEINNTNIKKENIDIDDALERKDLNLL